ncbi:MAG: hypothetical protein ACTSP4_17140 [Candidatus Hodarchaeales archaeon]
MPQIATWKEKKEAWDFINFFDMSNAQKIAAFTRARVIPKNAKRVRVQIMMRNDNVEAMSSKIYMAINRNKLKDYSTTTWKNIPPAHVAWDVYLIKTHKLKAGRTVDLGVYCQVQTHAQTAKKVGRMVMKSLVGVAPGGKVNGFSMKLKVIDYNYPCSTHKTPCQWRDDEGAWYCPSCKSLVTALS